MDEKYLNLTEADEESMIQREFDALLQDYAATRHTQKTEIIKRAFDFAKSAHHGVRRRSGEPYIMHPLAVARIVVKEIGLGSTSICSALLHDVVEDTDYTVEDIEERFGPKIAQIVSGLTKISGGIFGEKASEQAENFRRLILTMPEDVRVILIKMADRLHNMRTLGSMPPAKQLKISGETQYIYAPLAARLGFFLIKTELENLSFKYEQPSVYAKIQEQVDAVTPQLEESYLRFIGPIKQILDSYNYKYTITYRVKSPYSIFRKMQNKHIPFDEVYDLLAVRIILKPRPDEDERANCWVTYSALTSLYKEHPDRTRNWLSTPKPNGYEALHVTLMNHEGNWVEVQIRTERMNEIAEHGLAAHWKYKTGTSELSNLDSWFKSLKDMLDTADYANAVEFMDTFRLNLYASEIYVFTPKGDIKKMPVKSTALDFAFALHSDIGLHCIGAKVDHKLVPLTYELKSGDQVEILTSKNQRPQPDWIDIVTMPRAKAHLRAVFRKEYRVVQEKGKKAVEDELAKLNMPLNNVTTTRIIEHYKYNTITEFYNAVGRGLVDLSDITTVMFQTKNPSKWTKMWKLQFGKKNESVETDPKKKKKVVLTDTNVGQGYTLAECCHPIPGDPVLGYLDEYGTVLVHKRECPVALKLKSNYGNRIVTAEWATHNVKSFLAMIEINGIDERGVLQKIVTVVSEDYAINIKSVHLEAKDGIFTAQFGVYVHSADDLNVLCANLRKVPFVNSVVRIS